MAHFFEAIADLFKSIFHLFAGFFTTLFGLIQTLINAVVTFFASLTHLIGSTIKGTFEVAGETGKFLIGNALLIAVVAAGAIGYLRYQRNQGNAVVVGGKKLN